MTMPWFKMFSEARNDPKLRALSRDQHYVWFNILCFANEQPERGIIRLIDEEVLACAVADGDLDLFRSSLERLVKLQLVDRTEDGITPHGWAERQEKVDATAADRSKRYRERHKTSIGRRKNASRVTERDATRDERVTSRPVTETSRYRERDREEEEKTTQESVEVLKFDSPKEESCPEYPAGDGGMWDVFPGDHPMDEKQARGIFKMLWTGWQKKGVCFGFYQHQQRYPCDVWVAAIRKVKTQDKAINSIGYIETIAADYLANGIPKPKPVQAGSRASSPVSVPIKPLHPPGTIIPAKYLNPPQRIGSA